MRKMFIILKVLIFVVFFIIGIQPVDSVSQVGLLSGLLGVVLVGQWQIKVMIQKKFEETGFEKDKLGNDSE